MTRRLLPLLLLSLVSTAYAEDWPQWRGPARDGHASSETRFPNKLPADPKVLWHNEIGFGLDSPVVGGGKVFYLDNTREKEVVHAADAQTGAALWSVEIDDTFKDSQSAAGPRCTANVDGDRVYVQSCRGQLKCLNVADGKVLWESNFSKDFGATFTGEKGKAEGSTRHGNSDSPLVDGEHLIAGVGGAGAGYVCFNKITGKVVWKAMDEVPAYAAPVLATLGGVRQVVAYTTQGVIGFSPTDGKLLWKVPVKTALGRHATTPVIIGDRVIVGSFQAGLIGIDVRKSDGGLTAERAWTVKETAMNFASPVALGGSVFGVGPAQTIFCAEAETGKVAWTRDGAVGKQFAGMILVGKHLLVLGDSGELFMLSADDKTCIDEGKAQVCGKNWCTPAYVEGRLYIRDGRELKCIQLGE